jgi:hypothetical protein
MDVESSWKLKVLAECLLTMTPSLFVDFSVALCCGLSGGVKRDFPCVKGHSDVFIILFCPAHGYLMKRIST